LQPVAETRLPVGSEVCGYVVVGLSSLHPKIGNRMIERTKIKKMLRHDLNIMEFFTAIPPHLVPSGRASSTG
jgi:hypothetical protein